MLGCWDLVTAFDVIEHVPDPIRFIEEIKKLSSQYIFFTTPNRDIYVNPWHYYLKDIVSFICQAFCRPKIQYFARYKGKDFDYVKEWDGKNFDGVHYFGFLIPGIK
jgi:hypothetical protein